MTKRLLRLAPLAFAICTAAPVLAQTPPTTPEAIEAPAAQALVDAGDRWRQLYEAGDWAGLRALYADDAVLMTQGEAKIEGADAILVFLQRLSQQGGKATFQFAPEEAVIENGLGIVTAKYRMDIVFPGKDPVAVAGRSLLIYKWQASDKGGEWKLWRDIDNLAPDAAPQDFASDDSE